MVKLLVVDDHPLMGETIEFIIKNNRPNVKYLGQALSGKSGIEMVEKNQPDILLVDIILPGMDGLTMTQLLKESFPQLKVIIVTAFDDFDFIYRALRMGATDYLLKPFRVESLLCILDKITEELQNTQGSAANSYPAFISPLYHKLSTQIENGQIQQVSSLFNEIWQELISSANGDITLIRTRSIEIATAIIHLTDQKNLCNEALTITYSSSTIKIAKAQTVNSVETCLREFIETCTKIFHQYFSESEYQQIIRITDIIESNLHKDVTLENIAQKVYLNPSYLSRLFKKKTNVNFIDYLIDRRLEKAKMLLVTTDHTVESVAIEIGYDKTNSFRRLFKKKVGVSPSEYRELNKGNSQAKKPML